MNRIQALLAVGSQPSRCSPFPRSQPAQRRGESGLAVSKKIVIKVLATGIRARTTFWCGSGRPANWISFAIKKDGSFKAFSNTGSLTVWSIVGRFVTPSKAVAVLHLNATCDGKGGRFTALAV